MNLSRRDLLAGMLSLPLSNAMSAQRSLPPRGAFLPHLDWVPLDCAVEGQIAAGKLPGAVVILGDVRGSRWRRAWGMRSLAPSAEPMGMDTLFDLASLTKPVATTIATLQLVERGLLELDATVSRYWPAFASNGKRPITVRHLLTHSTGLRAGFLPDMLWQGPEGALRALAAEPALAPAGTLQLYSDLNFIALGELVRRRSGLRLDAYCLRHVFAPLGMRETLWRPPARLRLRTAPTGRAADGLDDRGFVQDPTARRMGGIAGHAGLFSTADDLARFAMGILAASRGGLPNWLSEASVASMALPQMCNASSPWRGLGWELEAPMCPGREQLPPVGTIHHTGYTGTALWIDLIQQRYVILLSNRLHVPGGDARPLRRQVAALASGASEAPEDRSPAFAHGSCTWPPAVATRPRSVQTGSDQLTSDGYKALAGQRIGLITHAPAIDAQGWRTLDRLRWARNVHLARVFSPEHGFMANTDGPVLSGTEPFSGLPLVSLYGEITRPHPGMLEDLDVLVCDLQDVGARFYTYASTMGRAMEAAAMIGLPVLVLDRPNPVGADRVGGPVLDGGRESFTAFTTLPVQHGMTIGELAQLFSQEIGHRLGKSMALRVVPMAGYRRAMGFQETGLDWVPPSPNLRTLEAALLYPGVAWVEGTNMSVGRGTLHPFGLVGAPWMDSARWMSMLAAYPLAGLTLEPAVFTPSTGPYRTLPCQGLRLRVSRADDLDAPLLGLALLSTLAKGWPAQFDLDRTLDIVGSRQTIEAIHLGKPWQDITKDWASGIRSFMIRREACLLYR